MKNEKVELKEYPCFCDDTKTILELYKSGLVSREYPLSEFIFTIKSLMKIWGGYSVFDYFDMHEKTGLWPTYSIVKKVSYVLPNLAKIIKSQKYMNFLNDKSKYRKIFVNWYLSKSFRLFLSRIEINMLNCLERKYIFGNEDKIDVMLENVQKIEQIDPVFYINEKDINTTYYDNNIYSSDGDYFINDLWAYVTIKNANFVITDPSRPPIYDSEFLIKVNNLLYDPNTFPNIEKIEEESKQMIEEKNTVQKYNQEIECLNKKIIELHSLRIDIGRLNYNLESLKEYKTYLKNLEKTLNDEEIKYSKDLSDKEEKKI